MGLLDKIIRGQRRHTSHAAVVDTLGKEILSGILPADAILPGDQELSDRFGVSRTVLREAMKTLAAKRLIEPKSRVGTRVLGTTNCNFFDSDILFWRIENGVDATFVKHLCFTRLALEPETAARATELASSEDANAIYTLVSQFTDPDHTRETAAQADLDFHLAIIEMSRNPFMRSSSYLTEAALAIAYALNAPIYHPAPRAALATEYMKIAQAIAAHEPAAARQAMTKAIHLSTQYTLDALKGHSSK